MMFRPYPLMTVLGLVSLVILLWLGQWQWQKYTDKIGRPAEEAAAAPDVQSLGFRAEPSALAQPQFVYGIADGESVWRRFVLAEIGTTGDPVLLALDAIGGANPVDVEAGLAPQDLATPRDVRIFDRAGLSSARNAPEDRLWYTFDRAGLLSAFGLSDGPVPVAEPVILTVRNADDTSRTRQTTNPYGAPRPIDPLPPERHFGYALTWWGLAAALIGVYIAFHLAQGRLSFRRSA